MPFSDVGLFAIFELSIRHLKFVFPQKFYISFVFSFSFVFNFSYYKQAIAQSSPLNPPIYAIGEKKPEKKKMQGFNGIRTRDLHDL